MDWRNQTLPQRPLNEDRRLAVYMPMNISKPTIVAEHFQCTDYHTTNES